MYMYMYTGNNGPIGFKYSTCTCIMYTGNNGPIRFKYSTCIMYTGNNGPIRFKYYTCTCALYFARCQSVIRPNIIPIVESSKSFMVIMLKCLRNRGVIGLRPPPGGPIAAISMISTSFIAVFSFKSYLGWRGGG